MLFQVTAIYAALLTLIALFLAYNVTLVRRRRRISLLDGGSRELARAMRAHGNLVEYAPFFLVLLLIAENAGASGLLLHALGAVFVTARIVHAYSIIQRVMYTRFLSTATTMAVLIVLACYVLFMTLMGAA